MSINQKKSNELRYIDRNRLTEESKVIGNYYRDIIKSYGIDCHYFVHSIPFPDIFSDDLNQNNMLLNAYGYDDSPSYEISADLITYMEVENDIFNLNKFGLMPSTNVNFYFDTTDFALALAPKLGVITDYKIEKRNIEKLVSVFELNNFKLSSEFISPNLLSGIAEFDFKDVSCNLNEQITVTGTSILNTEPISAFSVNNELYKSFNYILSANSVEAIYPKLTFKLSQVDKYTLKLSGYIDGIVLFRNLDKIGKYIEKISPEVGDVITIDFPDEFNREQYEITECTNRELTQSGINPLLHTYVWKCKAKRFVNATNDLPENNIANDIINQKILETTTAQVKVADKISVYPNDEDEVYGGYEFQNIISGKK